VQLQGAEAAARTVGVQLEAMPVRGADDFTSALKALRGIDGVLHADTPLFITNRARLVNAVARSRLPAIYPARVYVEAGVSCRTVQTSRSVEACRLLRGQDLERREARRASCRATNNVRVGDQQQDRQSHSPDDSPSLVLRADQIVE
jgi:hypothetical protein